MLSIEHLSCTLGKFRLQDVTFTVNKGDYFVLLGESGAGKTIILELLMGLTKPDAGRILLDARDISSLPIHRRSLGLVYQDHALFPHLSVRRNISYGLNKQSLIKIESLAQLGTPDEVFHHPKSRFVAEFVGIKNFFHGVVGMHGGERKFRAPALEIILPDSTPLGYGCVMFSSHDVTLSMEKPHGSARNVMHGKVADIEPVPGGLEVAVDVGIVICALITSSSLKELAIAAGLPVWLSFKATSVRFISAEEVLP